MVNFYLASAGAVFIPLLLYLATLAVSAIPQTTWPLFVVLSIPLILIAIIGTIHFYLVAPGHVSLFSLPAGCMLALAPHYIYCYHFARAGFFGYDFNFLVLGILFWLPPFVTSLACSLIFWLRR